jgi:hypothetical protein
MSATTWWCLDVMCSVPLEHEFETSSLGELIRGIWKHVSLFQQYVFFSSQRSKRNLSASAASSGFEVFNIGTVPLRTAQPTQAATIRRWKVIIIASLILECAVAGLHTTRLHLLLGELREIASWKHAQLTE